MESLAQNHGFVDGNKRTTLLVTLLMIERSGYRLTLVAGEWVDDVVVAVAEGKMDFDALVVWFEPRLGKP